MRWIGFAAFAAIACASPAGAEQYADDARIQALLVGKSALFSDGSIATYEADGGYNYVAANNLYYKGKYTISKGQLCLTLERGQGRCDLVGADAHSAYLGTSDKDLRRFSLSPPIVLQHVTTLCGVPVAYNVYPPPGSLPADVAAFSGTWVGKWDYGMCGALVVESIKPSGVASVIYVNGDFSLHSHKAGAARFLALINGKVLSDRGKTASFEAVMKDKDGLAVRRIGGPGAGTARLVRQ